LGWKTNIVDALFDFMSGEDRNVVGPKNLKCNRDKETLKSQKS
jgi:hypothetical protein